MSARAAGLCALLALLTAACTEAPTELPSERIAAGPLQLIVEAGGELRAVESVPLLVPGKPWQQRQLIWMAEDGSRVEAGDVVARFSPAQNELELHKALLDLERNRLARLGKDFELDAARGRLDVDLAQVGTQLAIAQRYAGADLSMFARNDILDAIEDERFLGVRRGVLQWRRDQASERGAAELAVLDAQRATFDLAAQSRREDLAALELRAPNAGVLVLSADWSGEKPKLGAALRANQEFATLPDPGRLEVELVVPQLEAQGIRVDDEVELFPLGRPEQGVDSRVHWVASAAQVRGGGSPVRYLTMRASVPAEAAAAHGWVPGQAFRARVYSRRADAGISVANVAIVSEDGAAWVQVREGGRWIRRAVELGARGIARSEVVSGLADGDVVLLTPMALPAP